MDISQSHVANEIGAVSMGESDVKFGETVFEFINRTLREYEEETYYDVFGRSHDQTGSGDGDVQEARCV